MSQELARPLLQGVRLPPGGFWTALRLLEETGSTNDDTAAAARAGAAEGLVVVAEHQRAGRGRAGRGWSSPPRAGLAVSVLLRPGVPARGWPAVPAPRWGWLTLLTGVALAETVTRLTGLDASLKWPNDLLVGGAQGAAAGAPQRCQPEVVTRAPATPEGAAAASGGGTAASLGAGKCAGILAEVAGEALVVGVGLNVTVRADELPAPAAGGLPATSLALAGARTTDRAALLTGLLEGLAQWYERWRVAGGDADGCGLRPAYQRVCGTLGRRVRVRMPDGAEPVGEAETVDADGRLVLRTTEGTRMVAAGDVLHLRPI